MRGVRLMQVQRFLSLLLLMGVPVLGGCPGSRVTADASSGESKDQAVVFPGADGGDGLFPDDNGGADGPDSFDAAEAGRDLSVEETGEVEICVASCTGKSCGDDGCGGSCGECGEGEACGGGACVVVPSYQWSSSSGGKESDSGVAMSVDLSGNLFLAGNFRSESIDLWGEAHKNGGTAEFLDFFLAKLDGAGALVWSVAFGGDDEDRAYTTAVDSAGDVYVSGYFRSSPMAFPDGSLENTGKMDALISKWTGDGQHMWTKTFGGEKDEAAFSLSVAPDDTLHVTGYFSDKSIDVGGGPLENANPKGLYDIFVAKYDKDGNHIWSKSFGGGDWEFGRGISVDPEGNVYLCGGFYSPAIDFGGGLLANSGAGEREVYVAKFDSEGTHLWSKSFGGPSHDECHSVAAGPDGSVQLVGSFKSPVIDFGKGPIQHVGSGEHHDIYIAKLTPDGECAWSMGVGGGLTDVGRSIVVDGAGNLFLTGGFESTSINFGGDSLAPAGAQNGEFELFMVMLAPNGDHLWSRKHGGFLNDKGHAVAVGPSGELFFTGYFDEGPLDFGGGKLKTFGGKDTFLVKFVY